MDRELLERIQEGLKAIQEGITLIKAALTMAPESEEGQTQPPRKKTYDYSFEELVNLKRNLGAYKPFLNSRFHLYALMRAGVENIAQKPLSQETLEDLRGFDIPPSFWMTEEEYAKEEARFTTEAQKLRNNPEVQWVRVINSLTRAQIVILPDLVWALSHDYKIRSVGPKGLAFCRKLLETAQSSP